MSASSLALIPCSWGVGLEAVVAAFSCVSERFCAVWGEDNTLKMAFSLWRTGFAAVGCT